MIKELLNRKIPQILGSYIVAGTSLVLFIDWLSARYEFSEHYVSMALFGLVSIVPSVIILAYFHGAPGKDEWTRIEKVGVPINILFIGFMLLVGSEYSWWIGGEQEGNDEQPMRVLISEITSNEKDMDLLKESIFNKNTLPEKLGILSEEEKNSIYDELISSLNMKSKNESLTYYTKYDLSDFYASKGEVASKFNFNYLRGFQQLDFQSENLMENLMQLNYEHLGKKYSMDKYMSNVDADLAYFPIMYKVTLDEYAVYHLVARQTTVTTITEEDTVHKTNFNMLPSYEVVNKNDLISMIINFMDEKIYYFTAINRGQIQIVDDDKIIIKFNNELKSRIKPRMIFKTQRLYSYDSDTDDLDELINTKIDDILNYEYHVEKDSTSIEYENYHSVTEYGKSLNIVYTKQELNDLLNGDHRLFKMGEMDGIKGATGGYTGIDIKILEVFDSTATAKYYLHPDKNLKLRKGDIFLY